MKKNLHKKLMKYSLAAGAVLMAGSADAQIIYTDEDPDFVLTEVGDYELDLDGNSAVDFTLHLIGTASGGQAIRFYPATGNEVLGSTSYSGAYFLPFALDADAEINGSQTLWNGTINASSGGLGVLTLAWGGSYGNWTSDVTDKYLGLRFNVDGSTHYGWMRLDVVANAGGFTVKDYAYNSVADEGLLAGEMPGVNIQEVTENSSLVFPNPTNGILNVKAEDATVKVMDVTGQVIFETTESKFDISNNPAGIYFVEINGEVEKVVLK